ncbi:hypothetical protein N657DRAFT_658608 [Parathielavia appendiculata]|uniref:Zn(2)-C6 fungal-type domain-containing protein n=1 Tax=Parathielavia appendiculata TaxID=2587402 RepID=A0AAN6Z196_9PEZI|nr:hypothetical protein N657DRAFT_658608 [Parathielavia appendiculata]
MDESATPNSEGGGTTPKRVLACQLCQQRKVKCDRKFPCSNCVRSNARCVPATLVPRQRRRRFPERELLARIRHYEALLQEHHIPFEPLHPPAPGNPESSNQSQSGHSPNTRSEPPSSSEHSRATRPRLSTNIWRALSQKKFNSEDEAGDEGEEDEPGGKFFHYDDDQRDAVMKHTWDRYHGASDTSHHLLFGTPGSSVDLTTLHPTQAKIFRLWQIYLDNVNPLLKVTHTPTMQTRIIDAVNDLAKMAPPLEALLFSIYCVALLSVTEGQCQTLFGSPRKELLAGYQFACRQALINANLQSGDYDSLTALFLYLVSVKPVTDPRALSTSLLAPAIRIAQHQGFHTEFSNVRRPTLEAEMRRRLWWALVVFDARICETFTSRTTTLNPTWDCGTPSNLNDFDLRPDMKTAPFVHERPTEALFVSVRSSVSDLVRHSAFHLDFTCFDPLLTTLSRAKKPVTIPLGASDETRQLPELQKKADRQNLLDLQRHIEEHVFAHCDPENPLHFMTMWTVRGYFAKNWLMEHCSWQSDDAPTPESHQPSSISTKATTTKPTEAHLHPHPNPGVSHALRMLECDTKLMSSPLTKSFHWYIQSHFPFLAYAYLVHYLKKRPGEAAQADSALWEAMHANYEARKMDFAETHKPLFVLFARIVLQAWDGVVMVPGVRLDGDGDGEGLQREMCPRIVARIKRRVAEMEGRAAEEPVGGGAGEGFAVDEAIVASGGAVSSGLRAPIGDATGAQPSFVIPGLGGVWGMLPGDSGMEFMDLDQFYPTTDWGLMQGRGW